MRTTRRAAAAALAKVNPNTQAPTFPNYRDDDLSDTLVISTNKVDYQSDSESEASDFAGKRKRHTKTTKAKPRKPAPLPPMSDDNGGNSRDATSEPEDTADLNRSATPTHRDRTVRRSKNTIHAAALPTILQIQVTASSAGPATINIDLASILGKRGPDHASSPMSAMDQVVITNDHFDDQDATLVDDTPSKPASKRAKTRHMGNGRQLRNHQHKAGFLDLPYELRVRIYRQLFVTESPIGLSSRKDLKRSSGFLSTCSTIHEEGRAVLYGENSFHFERCTSQRGAYWDESWKEIGFKDIRRFLDAIGGENISLLKYVSFHLIDAPPGVTSYLDEEERKCVNDPVLHYVFRKIGRHATLEKLAVSFQLRRSVQLLDEYFIKAFTKMSCHNLVHVQQYSGYRLSQVVLKRMKEVMVVPQTHGDDVDLAKKKKPQVKMFHDRFGRYMGW